MRYFRLTVRINRGARLRVPLRRPSISTPELRDDHAAYIASWIKVLKDDKRAIFSAASYAQRAVDFLLGAPEAAKAEAEAA